MASGLAQLPPPPTGQTGLTLSAIKNLPPPPQGRTGLTLAQVQEHLQPTAQSPSSSYFSQVSNAASAGAQKFQEGLNAPPSSNPLVNVENAAKTGAGAVEVASSPLAPLFSPLGKLIGYVSDKISNNQAIQKFAASPAGEMTSRVAQDVGNISEVAGAAAGAEGSAPVESALNTGEKAVASKVGQGAANVMGATTGTGASSIKEAFNGGQAFRDAMRGNINPDQVVQTAQDAVQNIVDARRSAYLSDLSKISENTKPLDITPIRDTLTQKLQDFGIKIDDKGELDFSRSSIANNGSARSDVQGVYNTLKSWGTQKADTTPVGLDTLKKQLADFYSPSGSARALIQAVKSKVSDTLNSQVPGYKDMTAKYADASNLLEDIKSATSIGGKAKADTILTKMQTAMKGDKDFRLQMLNQIQAKGAQPDLMSQIAGLNMNSVVPKGLMKYADVSAGFATLAHFIQPHFIPMFLATSPRVIGEFLNTLGMAKPAVNAIMNTLNSLAAKGITGAATAAPQTTKPQRPQQSAPQVNAK